MGGGSTTSCSSAISMISGVSNLSYHWMEVKEDSHVSAKNYGGQPNDRTQWTFFFGRQTDAMLQAQWTSASASLLRGAAR